MIAATKPAWRATARTRPAAAPRSSMARSARTSATRSRIRLLRLRDHSELLDAGVIHDVEDPDDLPVRHALVRLEERPTHTTCPQHGAEGLLEVVGADGDAVEVDGA